MIPATIGGVVLCALIGALLLVLTASSVLHIIGWVLIVLAVVGLLFGGSRYRGTRAGGGAL